MTLLRLRCLLLIIKLVVAIGRTHCNDITACGYALNYYWLISKFAGDVVSNRTIIRLHLLPFWAWFAGLMECEPVVG
jgi:hypothetical protein